MPSPLAERLAHLADRPTLVLTHYGRKSGAPFEVTIWFMVEDETVHLVTAKASRQWPRNVLARPDVKLRIGDDAFTGRVTPVTDRAGIDHAVDLMAAKYWYTLPWVWLARLLGWPATSAAFRVQVNGG